VHGTVNNYFSRNDKVLSVLYQVAELGSKPIGLGGIPTKAKRLFTVEGVEGAGASVTG
jgi:hypothetical protein